MYLVCVIFACLKSLEACMVDVLLDDGRQVGCDCNRESTV